MDFWIYHFNFLEKIILNIIFIIILLVAIKKTNYKNINYHSVIVCIIIICVFWSIKVYLTKGQLQGMTYHILGISLITIMLSMPLAIIIFAITNFVFILIFQGTENILAIGANFVFSALPSMLITYTILKLSRKFLDKNIFVFIFINALFAGAVSMITTGFINSLVLTYTNTYDIDTIWNHSFPIFILLMWAEAFMTAFLTTIFIAFKPEFLTYYNDNIYLIKKSLFD